MKKLLLLSLAISASVAGLAAPAENAANRTPLLNARNIRTHGQTPRNTAQNDDPTVMTFGYCKAITSGYNLDNQSEGNYIRQGAEVPAATATEFAGATVTAINVASGFDEEIKTNPVTDIKVFLTHDIQGEPFYTQRANLTEAPAQWHKITLDTPYTIEDGKPFYFGFEFTLENRHLTDCYYILTDGIPTASTEGGWIVHKENGEYILYNICDYGGNLCITMDLEGDMLPNGFASLTSMSVPEIVNANTPFPVTYYIQNEGEDPITSAEIEVTVNDAVTDTWKLDLSESPIISLYNSGFENELTIAEPCDYAKIGLTITKVNGKANKIENGSQSKITGVKILAEGAGYTRNVVVEEGTGTWCGWCPAGIVLYENARKTYTDGSMILIAVHKNDEMAVDAYKPFLEKHINGLPGYIVNRLSSAKLYYDKDMDAMLLDNAYNQFHSVPALAGISLKAEYADDTRKTVECYSVSEFAEPSGDNRYRIAYAVVEDNVGPYNQDNNFAGKKYNLDEWSNYSDVQEWTYNDVARNIIDWNGIAGSIPETVEPGIKYEHRQSITLADNVKGEDCRIVAMLIDTRDGTIENAVETRIDKPGAIDTTLSGSTVSIIGLTGAIAIKGSYNTATVYRFDGTTVASTIGNQTISLPSGIYIVNVDNIVQKVIVR